LDWKLVEALVRVESRGNSDAFRFEPKFWSRYLSKLPEWNGLNPRRVSSSYGLMQIMYPVAKERGFEGEPEELFQPLINLHWGCVHLRYLLEWAQGFQNVEPMKQLESTIASWNGGRGGNAPTDDPLRNGRYVERIARAYDRIQNTETPVSH